MNKNAYEIANASVEIMEIMKYAPLEIRLKIPKKYRNFFKEMALTSKHKWKYDVSKKLGEQNMSNMTKKILFRMHEKLF